ncbi:MAG: hypothetical protein PHY82_10985, partial [Lentisphaeria bacterium]|nr:hypothetical protein [Lentisphaeria bacterium]
MKHLTIFFYRDHLITAYYFTLEYPAIKQLDAAGMKLQKKDRSYEERKAKNPIHDLSPISGSITKGNLPNLTREKRLARGKEGAGGRGQGAGRRTYGRLKPVLH